MAAWWGLSGRWGRRRRARDDRALERRVTSHLEAELGEPSGLVLAIAVAETGPHRAEESLRVAVDGVDIPVTETTGPCGTRWHTVDAPAGALTVDYAATVVGRADTCEVTLADRIVGVRPSRYAQSDLLPGGLVPQATFERLLALPPRERVIAVREHVAGRLEYAHSTTGPTDGIPEALIGGRGVCRDFAHVMAGLLRASDLPARTASVYAPGLDPMDFHAVVEVAVDGRWWLVDATGLAPRSTMVRIATGRDAADTAFLANDGRALRLTGIRVTAEASEAAVEDAADWLPLT